MTVSIETLLQGIAFLISLGAFGWAISLERRLTKMETELIQAHETMKQMAADVRLSLGWTKRRVDMSQPVPTLSPEAYNAPLPAERERRK